MIPERLDFIGAAVLILRHDAGGGLSVESANAGARTLFAGQAATGFIAATWSLELEAAGLRRVVILPRRRSPLGRGRIEGVLERLQAKPLRLMCILRESGHDEAEALTAGQGAEALSILDRQSEMIACWRIDGTIYYCNDAYARQCGLPKAAVVGANLLELTPPEELAQILSNVRRIAPGCLAVAYDHRFELPDGTRRWHEWIDQALLDGQGQVVGFQSVGRDVTRRSLVEERLRDSEQRLRLALDAARLAIWDLDLRTGRIRLDAAAHRSDLRHLPEPLALGAALRLIHPEDRGKVLATYRAHALNEADQLVIEHRMRASDGAETWLQQHGAIVERSADGRPLRLVGVAADVTTRKEVELQLAELALQDHLTGLPNRRALDEAMLQAVARAERAGERLGVLLLDLDGFKGVNDSFGHLVGDTLLVETARRLRLCVRRGDVVSRFGGDEFTVLAGELKDPSWLERLAERIVEAVGASVHLAERDIKVKVSIGVAVYPDDGRTLTELLGRADAALYAAKREGSCARFAAELKAGEA